MTLTLSQSASAVGLSRTASFQGIGGTPGYTYAVLGGGAGGTIDPNTGIYISPAVLPSPAQIADTVQVTDSASATATALIAVGSPLLLLCDVIQHEMGLAQGRVYLWDQKIMQPTDSGLYIAVSVPVVQPFGNVNTEVSDNALGMASQQYIICKATIDIDVISRGPSARDRKEEVLLAIGSTYSEQQQEANGFLIGRIPPSSRFINLSQVDGAAIPYRYKISVAMQYKVTKTTAIEYFDNFQTSFISTDA